MKFLKLSVPVVFILLTSIQLVSAAKNWVDGELLVKFKNGPISAQAATANSILGAEVVETFPSIGWQRVKLPEGLSLDSGIAFYKQLDGVEFVQPNFYYRLLATTPNDPQFASSGMYGLTKISAPQAWDLSTGSSSVVVADIDTGMKLTHPDLAANAWVNTAEIPNNGIDDDNNGYIDDVNGYDFYFNDHDPGDIDNGSSGTHGTHTAGTMGAIGNNGVGVVGVNWNVKIMVVKIFNNSESGDTTTSAMLINAYNYIRTMKDRGVNVKATNNSYGGCSEACGYDQATKDGLDALGNDDILTIFAAGNDGINIDNSPSYPASYTSPTVVSVASSTSTDARSSFSSWGAASVDLAAPGSSILSTITTGSGYGLLSGTSMATPHVTGAVALLSAYRPTLSAASLKASLLNNVDQLAAWNGLVKTNGRLNVFKAMQTPTTCTFTLGESQHSVGAAGGSVTENMTAPANCDYSVKSNVNWITITAGDPGSGNSAFTFSVQANSGAQRSGTITVAGQPFSVIQGGNSISTLSRVMDFDGDGKTDYVAIQNNGGGMTWHIWRSTAGYVVFNFGLFAQDIPVPADYDGDGKADVAIWRGGTAGQQGYFYEINSSNGAININGWGLSGDDPRMVQDFDGDGKADLTVVRKAGGVLNWYVLGTSMGLRIYQFGTQDDLPLRGDYDGDGKADAAVYRLAGGSPANTFFALSSATGNLQAVTFGVSATDKMITGDFDGDGKTDISIWRNTDGYWHYLRSTDNSYHAIPFGIGGVDLPTPGDYDGDGKTDFSVWRPNSAPGGSGTFYVFTQLSAFSSFSWGNSDMIIPANTLQIRN
jgi:subtilisin family serine protease